MDKNTIDFSLYPECDVSAAREAVQQIRSMRKERKENSVSTTFEAINHQKWVFDFIRSIMTNAYFLRH